MYLVLQIYSLSIVIITSRTITEIQCRIIVCLVPFIFRQLADSIILRHICLLRLCQNYRAIYLH